MTHEPANPWLITLLAWVGGAFLVVLVVGLAAWWAYGVWRERRDRKMTVIVDVDGARGELVEVR